MTYNRTPRGQRAGGQFSTSRSSEPELTLFSASTLSAEPAKLSVVGYDDSHGVCERCGRRELRGTVVLRSSGDLTTKRYGTTCAMRVLEKHNAANDFIILEKRRAREVASMLSDARRFLSAGSLGSAMTMVHEARQDDATTLDELAQFEEVARTVQAIRDARDIRIAFQFPDGRIIEADSLGEAKVLARPYGKQGARFVTMHDGQWVDLPQIPVA